MLEGSAVFKGNNTPHQDDLYEEWFLDMQTCGLLGDRPVHSCIWNSSGLTPMAAAKRLAGAGLALLEDSPHGPMMTRTWRGTHAIASLNEKRAAA